jgi:hypothetical protein
LGKSKGQMVRPLNFIPDELSRENEQDKNKRRRREKQRGLRVFVLKIYKYYNISFFS